VRPVEQDMLAFCGKRVKKNLDPHGRCEEFILASKTTPSPEEA